MRASGPRRDCRCQMYTLDHEAPPQAAPAAPAAPATGRAQPDARHPRRVRGSDLHLTVGTPPMIRVQRRAARRSPATASSTPPTPPCWPARPSPSSSGRPSSSAQELDFAHSIVGVSRFRGNLYVQRNSCGAVFRAIPHKIKPLDELGMPDSVARFAHLPRGLVLVTGPTGSGKTTTLASMLDLANRSRAATSSPSRTRSSSCTRTSAAW